MEEVETCKHKEVEVREVVVVEICKCKEGEVMVIEDEGIYRWKEEVVMVKVIYRCKGRGGEGDRGGGDL